MRTSDSCALLATSNSGWRGAGETLEMRRFRLAFFVPVAVTLAMTGAACVGDGGELLHVHLRFIESDPQLPLPSQFLFSERVLRVDDFAEGRKCPQIWPRPSTPPLLGGAAGLNATLSWTESDVHLDFSTTETMDQFAVVFSGLNKSRPYRGNLRAAWASKGETFSTTRSLRISRATAVVTGKRARYRVPLKDQLEWVGSAHRFRLTVRPTHAQELIEVCSLELLVEELIPERLEVLLERGAKIALGDQLRNSLPGLPGRDLERTLQIPSGAELRFAYGVQAATTLPVRFRVLARIEGGEAEELLVVSMGVDDVEHWEEATVDLSRFSGQEIRLSLVTEAEDAFDPAAGLPLWGNPEVIAPR